MYAQSHVEHCTQEYNKEESYRPTRRLQLMMHCYVERYKSQKFIEIYRV